MMFFRKNDGAISVLLIFVLIPCLLFGGSTIDIAKLYASKVVISDAGEMALNAGLAQYESTLLDRYGLLLMKNTPDSMQTELQEFFDASLNGTGVEGDYSDLLHLATDSFESISIEASNICKTEVEKQQIIEYMKYRAPICMVELILEKFKLLKDTKKITEAMEKQIDFAESMDDCQDAIEAAEKTLNDLNTKLNQFPDNLGEKLVEIKDSYIKDLSKAILMLSIISNYSENGSGSAANVEELVISYIEEADKVNLNKPLSEATFNAYMKCLQIDARIRYAGGIEQLNAGTSSGEETSDETVPDENSSVSDNSALIEEYEKSKRSISSYKEKLNNVAQAKIESGYTTLSGYIKDSQEIAKLADDAHDALEKVKKEFDEAESDYKVWSDSVDKVEAGETKSSMQSEVNRYKGFFDTGGGSEDMSNLDKLLGIIDGDKAYFEKLGSALEDEKFWDESIGVSSVSKQKSTYSSNADRMVKAMTILVNNAYSMEENIRKEYKKEYRPILLPNEPEKWKIADDAFYKKIKEYSKKGEESDEKKGETNKLIEDGAEDASDVTGIDAYKSLIFNWESVSDQLISAGIAGENAAGSDLTGTVNDRSSRKSLLKKYKDAIRSATNFMDGVDRLIAKNIENLYIAEYAMQMFSCYTSNRASDGKNIKNEDVLSLSRYQLSNSPAYLAESEYILWGDSLSAQNVANTFMMIFGVRLLLNSIYTFTNQEIRTTAQATATAIAGATPYLVPVVKILIQIAYAAVESGKDIKELSTGKEVPIIKTEATWSSSIKNSLGSIKVGDTNSKSKTVLTFNYQDYLRVFINLSLIAGKEDKVLNRIADCIQINTEDYDLRDGYTMMGIHAEVSLDTAFIGPLSRWTGGDEASEQYTIPYYSVLGY